MAKYTMKQRIAYNEGLSKSGGAKGAEARGFLKGVKAQQTATRIARSRAEKRAAEAEGGKRK